MKILNIDDKKFRVFDGRLSIVQELPAGVYNIDFNQDSGYSLSRHSELTVNEKLYGKHEEKVAKILRAYDKFERSMGVIFSGDKGIGKSIAARMLCQKSVEKGLPVILVENNTPGIANFIDSIQQECVVLFDEFEKNFKVNTCDDDECSNKDGGCQDTLLSLFDGTGSDIKRLYLITCNNLYQLSDFLVNRPGRFHYHIRWNYPTAEEIEEYLKDKLKETSYGEIPKVVEFSSRVRLNYDCLRAIAFELNLGCTFQEAIEDLNIMNISEERFSTFVRLRDGKLYTTRNDYIDLFSTAPRSLHMWSEEHDDARITFVPGNIRTIDGKMIIKDFKFFDEEKHPTEDVTAQVVEAWIETSDRIDQYAFNLRAIA